MAENRPTIKQNRSASRHGQRDCNHRGWIKITSRQAAKVLRLRYISYF